MLNPSWSKRSSWTKKKESSDRQKFSRDVQPATKVKRIHYY